MAPAAPPRHVESTSRPLSAAASQSQVSRVTSVSRSRLGTRSSSLSRLTLQSSRPSQATARSTVLDLELMLERERREAVERELAELKEKLALLTGGTGGTGGTAPSASTVDKSEAVHLKKCLVDVWMNIDEHGMGDVMYHIVFVIQLCVLEMF
eukprot:symbB.v1.2.002502.t1/scaffold132.1/size310437/13